MKIKTLLRTMSIYQKILFPLFILFLVNTYAQSPVEVVYHKSVKDKGKNPSATITYFNDIAYLSKKNEKTLSFIDYNKSVVVDMINYKGKYFKTVEGFSMLPQPILYDEIEKIAGYYCKKAVFKAFSNTIEVWYTNKAPAKGSPYKNYLPANSLILKIIIMY